MMLSRNINKRVVDHVVVGLGGLGSASAYWLAQLSEVMGKKKQSIVAIEQFELGKRT